jgi:hypothetical protein
MTKTVWTYDVFENPDGDVLIDMHSNPSELTSIPQTDAEIAEQQACEALTTLMLGEPK